MTNCPEVDEFDPDPTEGFAQHVVEKLTGERLVARRPPGVDFWICREGLVVGGLEVTIAVPEDFARLGGQLEKHGDQIAESSLENNWYAFLDEDKANLARWDRKHFGLLVKAIEQHGIRDSQFLCDQAHLEQLARYGVEHLFAIEASTRGTIFLSPRGAAMAVDGSDVDFLVQERLEAKRRQLETVEGERHLFIAVAMGSWAAAAALFGDPSDDPPPLPEYVDIVWVSASREASTIWRRRRGEQWEIVPIQ